MERKFILSCASTVDMPYSYISGRDIPVLFYSYNIGDQEFEDDMCRTEGAKAKFYDLLLHSDKKPGTSQINEAAYSEFFEAQLQKGDLLHIAFGSGMSGSVNNAIRAADALQEKYPDRKIIVIDSYCSSSGYGMLVDYAADMRDEGKSIDEVADWVRANCRNIHHQFYTIDLNYYRRSGRMSGATAMLATILGICPIMRLDIDGRIIAYDKVRGKKKAIQTTLDMMKLHAVDHENYSGKCFICHSEELKDAEELRAIIPTKFPNIKEEDIRICDIGSIIACHCGPGTVAVFFLGDERAPSN